MFMTHVSMNLKPKISSVEVQILEAAAHPLAWESAVAHGEKALGVPVA